MPTRHELDAVSPNNPVFIPRGGHVITVNSKALELAGITRDTPNPDGGVIVRDDKGEATGVLLETAAYLVRKILPPPPANMADLLKIAMRDLNSYGIVGVVEPGVNEQQIALYRRVHDAGEMTVRTDVLYRALRKAEVEKGIAAIKAEKNSDMLRFVGIKFPLDGGVEGGRMSWPYRLVPGAPRYRGSVTRSATEWNHLCRGDVAHDRMVADGRMLMIEGVKLGQKTFLAAKQALGWVVEELDEFVIHQVSKAHTQAFLKAFGISPKKVMTIFGEHGNIGPASVPIVLSKLREMGRLKKGSRVALLGIGSGLNCSMAEVVW